MCVSVRGCDGCYLLWYGMGEGGGGGGEAVLLLERGGGRLRRRGGNRRQLVNVPRTVCICKQDDRCTWSGSSLAELPYLVVCRDQHPRRRLVADHARLGGCVGYSTQMPSVRNEGHDAGVVDQWRGSSM